MYTKVNPFLLHALSSVHAGSGSEIGIVDLPVQREQHTGFPKIESSSLKGAIRATMESATPEALKDKIQDVFGSDPLRFRQDSPQAGAIAFSDARILLFPVRSLRGIFAWITCPMVLQRFNQELSSYDPEKDLLPIPTTPTVSTDRLIVSNQHIVLEEYTFEVTKDDKTSQLANKLQKWLYPLSDEANDFHKRVVVLPDDDFNDFVHLSTEINARIKIDPESGTVAKNALWYEENIPPETIFYSFLFAGKTRDKTSPEPGSDQKVLDFVKNPKYYPSVFQLGGNSTLGRGMLRRIWL